MDEFRHSSDDFVLAVDLLKGFWSVFFDPSGVSSGAGGFGGAGGAGLVVTVWREVVRTKVSCLT